MGNGISTTVQELISKFERGDSVASQLEAINNEDPETITSWLQENDIWPIDDDYIFVIEEENLFLVEDDIFEYYEKDYLAALEGDGILKFINERFRSCVDATDGPTFHFHQFTPQTVISSRAESHGQAGIYAYDIALTKTHQERVEQIISTGYIFETDERFTYPTDLSIQKYHEFISPNLK